MHEDRDRKAEEARVSEAEAHLGAIEGDRPDDAEQQGNPNVPALDDEGLPRDETKVCEDVLGANVDRSQG
jgi:hypothetical protein